MARGIFDEEDAAQEAAARTDERTGTFALIVGGQVRGTFSSNADALRAAVDGSLADFSVLRVEAA